MYSLWLCTMFSITDAMQVTPSGPSLPRPCRSLAERAQVHCPCSGLDRTAQYPSLCAGPGQEAGACRRAEREDVATTKFGGMGCNCLCMGCGLSYDFCVNAQGGTVWLGPLGDDAVWGRTTPWSAASVSGLGCLIVERYLDNTSLKDKEDRPL